jgi:CBS domain-containing protein
VLEEVTGAMANDRLATEEHPVLVREVVHRDGSRGLALRVFCSRRAESVPIEECEACPSCVDIAADADGVSGLVRCRPPRGRAALSVTSGLTNGDTPGNATPVGTVLQGGVLCIGKDAEVSALLALLAERGLPGLFVVDDDGQLVGLVRDANLLAVRRANSTPALSSGLEAPDVSRVDGVMSTAMSVGEEASLRRALLRMASAHLREIPIVTREGQLVGVLRDIDGLRWLAAERRGKR